MEKICSFVYRLMEKLDGEKGKRYIPYKFAERVKILMLRGVK